VKGWNQLEKGVFFAFLFWAAAGLIFTALRLSAPEIAAWSVPTVLRDFVALCLRTGDPILILLAFANTHLHAARQWSPALARRWALIILVASLAVETLGALTGFPFGAYQYSDLFGPSLGVVPLTIPLAWHVVLTNALFLIRLVAPHRSRLGEAGLTGLLCTSYDFVLEPFATAVKGYWHWRDGAIPLQNYIAWFAVSTLLVWRFAPTAATRFPRDPRPLVILGATVLIFLAGRAFGFSG
jgi:putative membrane protein